MLKNIISEQRKYLKENKFTIKERKEALFLLRENIKKYEEEIYKALELDLNKSKKDTYISEIMLVNHEIDYMLRHIDAFFKPKKVKTPLFLFPSKSYIYKKSYGVSLIMSPWNYPFNLAMVPLVGAIAGGNSIILKTSRKVPNTNKIIKKILEASINNNLIYICDRESYDEILNGDYDLVFFTGSTKVGIEVLEKSSKNLCPVILELGGKSPVIIDSTADIKVTARRLAFGKLLNSGQTCIAPDYVFINKNINNKFLTEFKKELSTQYELLKKENLYCKMITKEKISKMKEVVQSEFDVSDDFFMENEKFIKPIVLENANIESEIMREEIFAPILPFIEYEDIEEVLKYIKSKPTPLALYIFSNDKKLTEKIIDELNCGGICVNDTLNHIANLNLPFGGMKQSGIGKYHGQKSLETFTSPTAVIKSKNYLDLKFKYYPFSEKFLNMFKKLF